MHRNKTQKLLKSEGLRTPKGPLEFGVCLVIKCMNDTFYTCAIIKAFYKYGMQLGTVHQVTANLEPMDLA